MDTIQFNDCIFGEMTYRHAWIKTQHIMWGDKNVSVKIKAKAKPGENIIDVQRQKYDFFNKNMSSIIHECQGGLLKFCQKNYDQELTEKNIFFAVIPLSILFKRDGCWGILFKCKWEDEINLVVKFDDSGIEVGVDDILL
jgi:hypothetical protein